MGRLFRTGMSLGMMLAALPSMASAQSATAPNVPATDLSRKGGTLSEKLSGTGGVIHPEDGLDPAMQKTPSAQGTMPVIPPRGTTSEGDATVVPK